MTGRRLTVLAVALLGAVSIADGQARGQAATPYPERTVRIDPIAAGRAGLSSASIAAQMSAAAIISRMMCGIESNMSSATSE